MLNIFRIDHFAFEQDLRQFVMSFCVVGQDFFSAFVLFGNDSLYFLVDHAGSLLTIRLGESPVLTARIVIIQVRKFFTHTEVDNHGVSLLGYPF